MNGTITLTRGGQVTIHTYTAPEAGWRSASHLIELATQLILVDVPLTAADTREVLVHAAGLGKPITRIYIRDFDRLAETTSTALELYERVLALYPDRVNPGALWSSARALKPPSS
jgi:hypothetical protein